MYTNGFNVDNDFERFKDPLFLLNRSEVLPVEIACRSTKLLRLLSPWLPWLRISVYPRLADSSMPMLFR